MAEFLTMEEAEDKFGKKGTARAGLTLGKRKMLLYTAMYIEKFL